jgi:hypothetical protein
MNDKFVDLTRSITFNENFSFAESSMYIITISHSLRKAILFASKYSRTIYRNK